MFGGPPAVGGFLVNGGEAPSYSRLKRSSTTGRRASPGRPPICVFPNNGPRARIATARKPGRPSNARSAVRGGRPVPLDAAAKTSRNQPTLWTADVQNNLRRHTRRSANASEIKTSAGDRE